MKIPAIAVPVPGFSDVCADEAKELSGASKVVDGIVTFSVKDMLELCSFIYRARTPSKVLQHLFDFKIKDDVLEDIKKHIKLDLMPKDATFVVRASTDDEQFDRREIEAGVGEIIATTGAKVNFSRPDITFYVIIFQGHCWFGIDLCGEELGKRDYRVFLGPAALKGDVAASLVRLAHHDFKKPFLDPFCRNGVIPIEAVMMATEKSPHYFKKEQFLFRRLPWLKATDWDAFYEKLDKVKETSPIIAMDPEFRNISATKKNAKIAGVVRDITFSRTDLEFLDAKFGKKAVETIVTMPPQPSSNIPQAKLDALLKDIFYQAEFVLMNKGTCVMITQSGAEHMKKSAHGFGFVLEHERKVWQGQSELTVLIFRNK